MILKRMKRRHSREQAIDLVARLKEKRPEIAIGAGHYRRIFRQRPKRCFANSMDIVDQCDVIHGHIFPYSPRQRTPAAKMPQVDGTVIKQRAKALREKVANKAKAWRDNLVGTRQNVLCELNGKAGYAENFCPYSFRRNHARRTNHPRRSHCV